MQDKTIEHFDSLLKAGGTYKYAAIVDGVTYLYEDADMMVKSLINDFQDSEEKELFFINSANQAELLV